MLAVIAIGLGLVLLRQFEAMSSTSRVVCLVLLVLDAAVFGANAQQLLEDRQAPVADPADR